MGLEYPIGATPRFDPAHLAASNTLFSGIASGPNFVNTLTGQPGTPNGGVNAPSANQQGIIGPSIYIPNNGNITFPYQATAWAAQTMAAIVAFDSATSGSVRNIMSTSASGLTGMLLAVNTGGANTTWSYEIGGTLSACTGSTLQAAPIIAGMPYFWAVSIANGLPVNTVLVQLGTGRVSILSIANALSFNAGDATIYIGNRGTNTRQAIGKIAAAMHANNYLSIPQLLQWASDPWSFWYPTE